MKLPAQFLNLCAAIAVLFAAQCWVVPMLYGFEGANWTIAWCDSGSSNRDWWLLYAWTMTVVPIIVLAARRKERVVHFATLGSFGAFWILLDVAKPHAIDGDGVWFIGICLGLMIWCLRAAHRGKGKSDRGERTKPKRRPA